MVLEPFREGERILAVALGAQGEGFEALQEQERPERILRRTEVAKVFDAGANRERGVRAEHAARTEDFPEIHAVIPGRRVGEVRELAVRPVERTAVDEHAADRRAVTADPLGGRVHDDVGSVVERAAEVAARTERVVDNDRQPVAVGDVGDGLEVGDVVPGIPDRFEIDGPGVVVDERGDRVDVVAVGELHVDAQPREGDLELVVGASVQVARRYDVAARAHEGRHRQKLGRLPAGGRQRRDAALERGHALLEDVARRVHDAGIDVAELLQRKQLTGVLGVVERVGGRGVDRDGAGVRARRGRLPRVELQGLELVGSRGRSFAHE